MLPPNRAFPGAGGSFRLVLRAAVRQRGARLCFPALPPASLPLLLLRPPGDMLPEEAGGAGIRGWGSGKLGSRRSRPASRCC